ncbi:MAG: GTP-binding protein LepA, partial [Nocardioides sp.]
MRAPSADRLVEHVRRLGEEHPPLSLDAVDLTVRDPARFEARFGHVLDYMARVELEVDRNVLELTTML